MAAGRIPRFVAFLRAVNVGGRTVTNERLRDEFAALGFDDVSTFLASGNVLFIATEGTTDLDRRIEAQLQQSLGYEVATFVRSAAELVAIAAYDPFPGVESREGDTVYVNFLRQAVTAGARRQLAEASNDLDLLHTHKRELYWLRRGPHMESTLKTQLLDRAVGISTNRNMNTVRRLVAKLSG
ncbi:MAG: DUF1697 domain-containing protein [Acidimicrobiales bacterium]